MSRENPMGENITSIEEGRTIRLKKKLEKMKSSPFAYIQEAGVFGLEIAEGTSRDWEALQRRCELLRSQMLAAKSQDIANVYRESLVTMAEVQDRYQKNELTEDEIEKDFRHAEVLIEELNQATTPNGELEARVHSIWKDLDRISEAIRIMSTAQTLAEQYEELSRKLGEAVKRYTQRINGEE